jgi:hypothetical protein
MAKNSSNILALGVGLNLDPLNQDIANAAKTAKEGMAVVGQSVVDGGAKASGATEKLGDKVQTMRQQLRLATQDAQAMAEKYGIMSRQAIASASRAGELKDKIGDINTVITAFSADSKFTVVAGAMQSAAGAASIVTGAMGLLGTESKATQEMLLKVQSALALTQGLAQIKEMGASFTALRAVIVGQVIPSILAINTATMVGIGAVIVAIGAITLAVYKYNQALDEEAKLNERVNNAQIANIANKKKLYDIIDQTAILQNQAQGKTLASELFANETSYKEAKKALDKKNKDVEGYGTNRGKILYQLQLQENALEDNFKRQAEEIRAAYAKKELDANTLKNKQLTAEQEAQAKAALAAANKYYKGLDEVNKKFSGQALINAFAGPKDITGEKDASGLNAPQFIPITYKIKTQIDTQETEFAIKQATDNIKAQIDNLIPSVKNAIVGVVTSALAGIGEAIAGALSGDDDPFEAFGIMLIKSLGQMAVQLGSQMLAIGAAMLFVPTLQSQAAGYLLGGAALVVAGSAVSGLAGRKSQSTPTPSGGGGGNNSNLAPKSNYIGGQNSGQLVIQGYVRGNDINFVNGKSGSKNNRSLRFG